MADKLFMKHQVEDDQFNKAVAEYNLFRDPEIMKLMEQNMQKLSPEMMQALMQNMMSAGGQMG